MSGLKDKASRINFAGLPKAAPDSRSDTVAGESRRPKTAPGLLMSQAAEQRSEILMENERLAAQVVRLEGEAGSARAEITQLGERLRDVLHDVAQWDGAKATRLVDPALVVRSKWANRDERSFAGVDFQRLRDEIASAGGNVQPIKLRPVVAGGGDAQFEVVFGHRRFEACRQLGLPVLAVIDAIDDQTLFVEMDRENRQRKNLSPWEQGVMYRRALDDSLWPSNRKMAEALGVDLTNLGRAIALAELPELVVNAFPSPLDLQFRWAARLKAALQRAEARVLARAAEIATRHPRPSGRVVMQLLMEAADGGSTVLPPAERHLDLNLPVTLDGRTVGRIQRDQRSGGLVLAIEDGVAKQLDLTLFGVAASSAIAKSLTAPKP